MPVKPVARQAALLTADCVSFTLTVVLALANAMLIRYHYVGVPRPPQTDDLGRILIVFGTSFAILLFRSWTLGHYTRFRPFWAELQEVVKTVLVIAAANSFLLFAIGVQFSRLWFGSFLLLLVVLVPYFRERTKMLMIRRGLWYQPTCIVGIGENARKTADALDSDSSLGHQIIGFIDVVKKLPRNTGTFHGHPVYTSEEHAQSDTGGIPTLVFALDSTDEMDEQKTLINKAIASSTQVTIVPPQMALPLYGAKVEGIFRHDSALLKISNRLADPNAQKLKRLVDYTLSLLLLLPVSALILVLGALIKTDGGPVFYKHRRIGRNGKPFDCLKFRSMKLDSQKLLERYLKHDSNAMEEWDQTRKLKHDPRVTRIGRYLRRTSIDELPQLINVIKGEMSLVGPRPIVLEEQHHYGDMFSYYKTMRPGMTGLWQVSGRNDTSYNERVQLDVWYCRNWSLWNDVVVLIKTCKILISRHGAY